MKMMPIEKKELLAYQSDTEMLQVGMNCMEHHLYDWDRY